MADTLQAELPPLVEVDWPRCFRLIPAKFPPEGIFDDVCDPEELEILYEIEALTNDRLRQALGQLHLVPDEDRISGPGTTPIMAAFTHIHPDGSRFTDGTFGSYYAADSVETAIAETKYHRERFLRATGQPPCEITQRCYINRVIRPLRDIREGDLYEPLHHKDTYAHSQPFGRQLRHAGEWGIIYRSARREGGHCVAVFRPTALTPVIQGPHYAYVWDGEQITWVFQKSNAKRLVNLEPTHYEDSAAPGELSAETAVKKQEQDPVEEEQTL